MKFVLGIDFGGGASKATLMDKNGKVVATSVSEYETIIGEDGLREQRPNDWYLSTIKNIKSVTSGLDSISKNIECICFDAATHTAVLMDNNYNVIRNSIYWTDTRSIKQKKFLIDNYGDDILSKFKHTPDTIWTLTQLFWIKENEPKIYSKIKKITFAKDYVRHMFTGDFVTDYIEAEGSMFFDFDKKEWSEKYLDLLGLNKENLPKVVSPDYLCGKVNHEIASMLGLSFDTKVICGTTDTAMEVLASGAIEKGQATIKLATAGRICVVSDKIKADKNIINYSHIIDGLYYPGTATKSCASSLRWLRDTFSGDYESFDKMAENIPIGADGLIFHPYLNGELTPYGNPLLKGSFVGITSTHTKAHFIRSVLEGVVFSLKDCKDYLESNGINKIESAFIIGGGAKSKLWKQIVADTLEIQLISTENNDSSFGSCLLSSVEAKFFNNLKDAVNMCSKKVEITKPSENSVKYKNIYTRYKKLQTILETYYNE